MLRPAALTLAVFGPGLLGGSLLHDARALNFKSLRVWARREESLGEVQSLGLADFTSTRAAEVAEGADLLVLCVPVGGMKSLAQQIAGATTAPGAVFTDVGSVKGLVMGEVAPVFTAAGAEFCGSHPMAGSDKGGLANARAGLYQNAACILTPAAIGGDAPALLHGFWRLLGSRTHVMDAATHDTAVARISHLPHVAAVLTALAAMRPEPGYAAFAAGGLRDTTRVANGDPSMWCEILMENREAILPALRDLAACNAHIIESLETGDAAALNALLSEARALRASRYPDSPDAP